MPSLIEHLRDQRLIDAPFCLQGCLLPAAQQERLKRVIIHRSQESDIRRIEAELCHVLMCSERHFQIRDIAVSIPEPVDAAAVFAGVSALFYYGILEFMVRFCQLLGKGKVTFFRLQFDVRRRVVRDVIPVICQNGPQLLICFRHGVSLNIYADCFRHARFLII